MAHHGHMMRRNEGEGAITGGGKCTAHGAARPVILIAYTPRVRPVNINCID